MVDSLAQRTLDLYAQKGAGGEITPEDTLIRTQEEANNIQRLLKQPRDVTAFDQDPEVLKDFETVTDYFGSNRTFMSGLLDPASMFNDRPSEAMRDEFRISTLANRAMDMKDATPEIKEAYNRLREKWEGADIQGFDEWAGFVKDYGIDLIANFETIPMIAAAIYSGGAAPTAANATVRKALHSALQKGATAASNNPFKFGAAYGGTFSSAADISAQNLNMNLDNQDEFSYGQNVLSTGLGTVLGGGINWGLSKVISKAATRRAERATDNNSVPLSQSKGLELFDEGIEGEWIPSSGSTVIDEVDRLLAGNRFAREVDLDDIELGDFDEILDDFVADVGGGQATRDQLDEVVLGELKSGATGEVIKNNIAFNLWKISTELVGTMFGGKSSGILTSYVPYSKTAETLRQRLSFDFGIKATQKQDEVVGMDFAEVARRYTGIFRERYREALAPLGLDSVNGSIEDSVSGALNRAIRGQMSPDMTINTAAKNIQNMFRQIGEELHEAGVIAERVDNYIPRMWNGKAIKNNRDEFERLLVEEGEAASLIEARRIVDEMLDIKNQLDGGTAGHFFSSKRKFTDIKNEAKFTEFLEDDLINVIETYNFQAGKSLAKVKVFKARNEDEFKAQWLNPIVAEMQKAGRTLSPADRARIVNLYRLTTGENVERFGNALQTGVDGYQLATRLAMLPLATVGSVTEILINLGKGGVLNTAKGFKEASEVAYKTITNDLHSELKNRHGLTTNEVWRELQSFGKAMDQSVGQIGNRLAGDDLIHEGMQEVSNKFFRLNLLDQWTKFVQISSYATGKNLIEDNLKAIAAHGSKARTGKIDSMIGELNELGIDYKAGVSWINSGAKKSDDYYKEFTRGASRYVDGVILQPTAMSNLKPTLYSNPKTTILFQLLGYPAAFTNTVLKGAAKSVMKDPKRNGAKVMGAALSMTAAARFMNWVRSRGESEAWHIDESEKNLKAIARWGGNGLFLDTFSRSKKEALYGQNPAGYLTMPFGPLAGEVLDVARGRPAEVLGNKIPLVGLGTTLFGQDVMRKYRKTLKNIDKGISDKYVPDFEYNVGKEMFSKGGEVEIDRAASEPDERINKVTGVPYNVEAGTAFMDELDEGRTQRFGFNIGGKVAQKLSSKLAEEINVHTEGLFNSKAINNIADDINETVTLGGNLKSIQDAPATTDDFDSLSLQSMFTDEYDFEEYVDVVTKSVLEGDVSSNELLTELAEEIDPNYEMFGAITASLENLKVKKDNLLRPEFKDLDLGEEEELLEPLTKFVSKHISSMYSNALTKEGAEKAAKQHIASLIVKADSDDEMAEFIKETAQITPVNRDSDAAVAVNKNLNISKDEFIADSEITVPVFRGVSSFNNHNYDIAYAFPREMGVHYGNQGQANYQALKEINFNSAVDNFALPATGRQKVSKKEMFNMFKEEVEKNKNLTNQGFEENVPPVTILKGYLNIKNPLFINSDMGSWSVDNLLTKDYDLVENAIEDALGRELNSVEITLVDEMSFRAVDLESKFIRVTSEDANSKGTNKVQNEIAMLLDHARLTKDFQSFLKGLGFDGIKYKNQVEPPFKGEEFYSYIAFDPQQFKNASAAKFDLNDPRDMYSSGGSVIARKLGIPDEALSWARSQRDRFPKSESYDGIGDAAAHLALGFITKNAKHPRAALFAANAREFVTLDHVGGKMDIHNNKLGSQIQAKDFKQAEQIIDNLIADRKAVFMTPSESKARRGYSKGGQASYTVESGDTLTSIAKNAGTTIEAIMGVNDISNADLIYVDQKLVMPVEKEFKENKVVSSLSTMRERQGRVNKTGTALNRLRKLRQDLGVSSDTLKALKNIKERLVPKEKEPKEKSFIASIRQAANNQVVRNFADFFNPFQKDKTEADYNPSVIEALRFAAKSALNKGKFNIDYSDYNLQESNVRGQVAYPEQRERDNLQARMIRGDITPTEEAAFSVGGAQLAVEDGKVYVTDVYNFNNIGERISTALPDNYTKLRTLMGKIKIPTNDYKSKIYVGELDELQDNSRSKVNIGGKIAAKLAPRMAEGFYSPLEKASLNLTREKGTGNSFLQDLKKGDKGRVTDEELVFTGVQKELKGLPSTTKEEVQQIVSNNKIELDTLRGKRGLTLEEQGFDELSFNEAVDDHGLYAFDTEFIQSVLSPEVLRKLNSGEIGFDDGRYTEPLRKMYLDKMARVAKKDIGEKSRGKYTFAAEFSDYTLAGKAGYEPSNYRVIALRTPKNTGNPMLDNISHAEHDHWGSVLEDTNESIDNIIAHIRVTDGLSGDNFNKTTMLIEEIQSDYHKQGGKHGYTKIDKPLPYNKEEKEKIFMTEAMKFYDGYLKEVKKYYDDLEEADELAEEFSDDAAVIVQNLLEDGVPAKEIKIFSDKFMENKIKELNLEQKLNKAVMDKRSDSFIRTINSKIAELNVDFIKELGEETSAKVRDIYKKYSLYDSTFETNDAVADAPFKNSWPRLTLSKALIEAVEHGNKRIALTTGKSQAARYSDEMGNQQTGLGEKYDTKFLKQFKKLGSKYNSKVNVEEVGVAIDGNEVLATEPMYVMDITPELENAVRQGLRMFYEGGLIDA